MKLDIYQVGVCTAGQLSARGGELHCRLDGNRVMLTGEARTFLTGTIEIPD